MIIRFNRSDGGDTRCREISIQAKFVRCIVIEAMALVLSGEWERLEEDLNDKTRL